MRYQISDRIEMAFTSSMPREKQVFFFTEFIHVYHGCVVLYFNRRLVRKRYMYNDNNSQTTTENEFVMKSFLIVGSNTIS